MGELVEDGIGLAKNAFDSVYKGVKDFDYSSFLKDNGAELAGAGLQYLGTQQTNRANQKRYDQEAVYRSGLLARKDADQQRGLAQQASAQSALEEGFNLANDPFRKKRKRTSLLGTSGIPSVGQIAV